MPTRIATIFLVLAVAFGTLLWLGQADSYRLPGNRQGYEPVQPVAFSHRLHAGELQINCLYCHSAAEKGRHAGIPPAGLCMNCHSSVTAPLGAVRDEEAKARREGRAPRTIISPELQKLYDALALDTQMKPVEGKSPKPIEWVRVHKLPAFACFDHRSHVGAGLDCRQCHGSVEGMERVRQEETLSMGWCMDCHRQTAKVGGPAKGLKPPTDCAACHN